MTKPEIWIFAEQKGGKLKKTALELLSEAQKLAQKSGYLLAAVLLSDKGENYFQELFNHGAQKIYNIEDPKLAEFNNDYYSKALSDLIKQDRPEIILFGATYIGRCLAPTIAARVYAGLTADCTSLDFDTEKKILLQTRPAFGGNIMATIACPNHRPQMATVRGNVFKTNKLGEALTGEVEQVKIDLQTIVPRMKKIESVKEVISEIDLTAAQYIVAGGRGVGGPEGFVKIKELADLLGGSVGASRATVDAGWIDHHHQVGQTGKTVCPVVYIACGISGAIQHLAGMQSADVIIAINKDPDAPIFDIADYGLVGDLHEVVPAFIKQIKQIKGEI